MLVPIDLKDELYDSWTPSTKLWCDFYNGIERPFGITGCTWCQSLLPFTTYLVHITVLTMVCAYVPA